MPITADELKEEIENLEAQRKNAAEVYQQATGAILLAKSLLERLEAEEKPEQVESA